MAQTSEHPTFLYEFASSDVRIVCPLSERTADGRIDVVTPYGFPASPAKATIPASASSG